MTATDPKAPQTPPSTWTDTPRGGRPPRRPAEPNERPLSNGGANLGLTDEDGDQLDVTYGGDHLLVVASSDGFYLHPENARELRDHLTRWLCAEHGDVPAEDTAPDPLERLADWERELLESGEAQGDGHGNAWCLQHGTQTTSAALGEWSTITRDAEAAVYGSRSHDYGHPREDFTRTAILWTGLLHHKLADGAHLEPEDIARCMIAVKLARDVHSPKRDNRVDIAGYALTLDRLETGQ